MKKKTNFVKENRLGRFKISNKLINNDPKNLLKVMQNFIIIRAESLFFDRSIEYFAYSPLFKKIKHGDEIPAYLIEVNIDENDELTIKAKEIMF